MTDDNNTVLARHARIDETISFVDDLLDDFNVWIAPSGRVRVVSRSGRKLTPQLRSTINAEFQRIGATLIARDIAEAALRDARDYTLAAPDFNLHVAPLNLGGAPESEATQPRTRRGRKAGA